jgi:D-alanyl-D-alanine carboxypeptidase
VSDAESSAGGRAGESKPDQGEPTPPVTPAWPAAEAGPWPGDDTDDPTPAPLRDETHVGPDEPSVTPPGEPDWPADDPGPTTELPVPTLPTSTLPTPTLPTSSLPTPSASDASPTPDETPTHAFPTADTDSPPPTDSDDVTPAPADSAPDTHSTADAPADLSSSVTAEVPRPTAPAAEHPESPDDHTSPNLPAAEQDAEPASPAARQDGHGPTPPPGDSSPDAPADARDPSRDSPGFPADEHDQDGSGPSPDDSSPVVRTTGGDEAAGRPLPDDSSPDSPAERDEVDPDEVDPDEVDADDSSPNSLAVERQEEGARPGPDDRSAGSSERDEAGTRPGSDDAPPPFPAAGGDEAASRSLFDDYSPDSPVERDEAGARSGSGDTSRGFSAVERDEAGARPGPDDTSPGFSPVERDQAGARPGPDDTSPGFSAVSPDSATTSPTARPTSSPTTRPTAHPAARPSRPDLPRRGPVPPRPYGRPPGPPPTGHPPRPASPERPAERTMVVRPVRSEPPHAARPRPEQQQFEQQTKLTRPEPPAGPTKFVRPVTPEPPAERTTVVRPAPSRSAPPEEPAERTTVVAAVAAPASEADSGPEAESPRRKTALIVGIAVVAVLALAAGVVFWVPGVAEKLGLSGDEPAAIAPPPAAVEFRPALAAPGDSAPAPTPDGVAAALAGPAAASGLGALTGVVIDPANGQVLYAKGGGTARVPASTTKVLSAAAVLLAMPHTDQLSTKVVRGDKPGTVVIVGGGDATLSALAEGKESVYPGAPHLDDLVEQVKATGPVDTVLVDVGRYTGPDFAAGWERVDIAAGHITPIVPAMLDGGRGDPTKATTARSANPARTIAQAVADRLGATVPAEATTTAKPDAEVLGEVKSAPVVELVDTVLQRSDNVLAETLIRELAVATGKDPSFTGATEAVAAVLKENGFTVEDLLLRDGSGLSTQNRATATLLAEVLQVAAAPDGTDPRTAKLRPLLAGLPVAGGSGTLAGRYQEGPAAEGRGWVRAKTGTLPSVRANSLAGIVLDTDGRLLVFALMADGPDTLQARADLDDVAAALHGCGCR